MTTCNTGLPGESERFGFVLVVWEPVSKSGLDITFAYLIP